MMWDVTVPYSIVPSNHSAAVSGSASVAAMAEARKLSPPFLILRYLCCY